MCECACRLPRLTLADSYSHSRGRALVQPQPQPSALNVAATVVLPSLTLYPCVISSLLQVFVVKSVSATSSSKWFMGCLAVSFALTFMVVMSYISVAVLYTDKVGIRAMPRQSMRPVLPVRRPRCWWCRSLAGGLPGLASCSASVDLCEAFSRS